MDSEQYFPDEAYLLDSELNLVPAHPEAGSDGSKRESEIERIGILYSCYDLPVWAVESPHDRVAYDNSGPRHLGSFQFYTTSHDGKVIRLGYTDNFVETDGLYLKKGFHDIRVEMLNAVVKNAPKLQAEMAKASNYEAPMAAFG